MKSQHLLSAIREDFTNVEAQLRYAAYLVGKGDEVLARYVGLRATMLGGSLCADTHCTNEQERRAYLDSHPECWQWDDFLSQRFVESYREDITGKSVTKSPAKISDVTNIEGQLGCLLPFGYRSFLLEISDGSSLHAEGGFTFPPVLYSCQQLTERLDATGIARAQGESLLGWTEMKRTPSEGFRVLEMDEDEHYSIAPNGFLEIGDHGYGTYYLGLRGQLRGTIWGCCLEEDTPLTTLSIAGIADYPETKCTESVQKIPLDSIRAIHSLVLERHDEAKRLAD